VATSQTQIFLDLSISGNRVRGEATIQGFEDQIEIDDLKFEVKASAASPKQGDKKLSTRLEPGALTFSKVYDKSSNNLMRNASSQLEFDYAKITVNQAMIESEGTQRDPILVIELWEGVIKSVNLSMSGSGISSVLKEDVVLTYKEVRFENHFSAQTQRNRIASAATVFHAKVKGADE
jgi:type VI protein secretion system component Hcp